MHFRNIILLVLLALSFATAQTLKEQKTFKVTGYSISQIGYPSKVVSAGKGNIAWLEYWVAGQEDRKFSSYYLQCYNPGYSELWFTPVTAEKAPKMQVLDMYKMGGNIAVLGYQYSSSEKRNNVMVQYFTLDGKPKGGCLKVSNYDKKSKKGFEETFVTSPDTSMMLWMGYNPAAPAKMRKCFISVWTQNGTQLWGAPLNLPHAAERYKVKQVEVDNKGNAYFLMVYDLLTNTAKDTVNLPIILRYDYKSKKFTEHKLDFPQASVPEITLHVTRKNELYVVGALTGTGTGGFMNGAKAFGTALRWNQIVYKKFKIEMELKLEQDLLIPMPESMSKQYATEGANFSKSEIVESGNKIMWVLEEYYTQIHNKQPQYLYYDVAVLSFDTEQGTNAWTTIVPKKQRDYVSGRLLSYALGISGGKMRFVYLTEKGAQGKIVCSNVDVESGKLETKPLVENFDSKQLFFPRRSGMVNSNTMILMGVGDPVGNEYKLMKVEF